MFIYAFGLNVLWLDKNLVRNCVPYLQQPYIPEEYIYPQEFFKRHDYESQLL